MNKFEDKLDIVSVFSNDFIQINSKIVILQD